MDAAARSDGPRHLRERQRRRQGLTAGPSQVQRSRAIALIVDTGLPDERIATPALLGLVKGGSRTESARATKRKPWPGSPMAICAPSARVHHVYGYGLMRQTGGMSGVSDDEAAESPSGIHECLADLVLQGLANEVVDLGAGEGRTLIEIARRAPGSVLTAIDLDDQALANLWSTLPNARTLRHDLAEVLPLADGSVDVVVSHNTLECLLDPAALLREIARVLRPGAVRSWAIRTSRRSW